MYFYNKKYLHDTRRKLRNNPTPEEQILWKYLRKNSLGYKFRRQHSIGPYIVDFCCPNKKLIIELDGDGHRNDRDYDLKRDEALKYTGYTVIRFWNSEVRVNLENVLQKIADMLHPPSP
jgi:very-short-patch-repair endonuclease